MAALHILLMMQLPTTEIHISLRRRIQTKSRLTHLIGLYYPLKVIQGLQAQPVLPVRQVQRVQQGLRVLMVLQGQQDLPVQPVLQGLQVQTQQ